MFKSVIDILAIAFICLNVLAFEIPLFGIPLRFWVMIGLLGLTIIADRQSYFTPFFVRFILFAYGSWSILVIYSLLMGNELENVLACVRPLLMFMLIPSYKYAFSKYGEERYVKALSLACIVLIAIFFVVLARVLADPSLIPDYDEKEEGLIIISKSPLGARILIKTFVFLIPFAIYVMSKIKNAFFYLFFVLILAVLVLSQTLGFIIPIIFFYFYILLRRKKIFAIAMSLFLSAAIVSSTAIYFSDALDTKEESADVKSMQVDNAFKDMNIVSLFFGRGIGCEFKKFDSRGITESTIEVAAIQMFQWGGFIFTVPILFVYILPGVIAMRKQEGSTLQILGLSQVGLFIASLSNPYLWGGTGLLLNVLILASPKFNKLFKA